MNKKSTLVGKCILLLTIATFFSSFYSQAQTDLPKLKFRQPQLVAGIAGQKDVTYKFTDVIPGVDAFVKIESLVKGAILINIDDSTLGYYDAWQPTVGGPGTYGSSYIKWAIEFKTTSGTIYQFPQLDASAIDIDIDGDNVRVREFVDVNGQSSYDLPTQIPSLLTVNNVNDTDNVYGDDPNPMNLHALGPVINRTGIDTLSQDVRINYHFIDKSKIKIYTGSQIDSNGTTGAIATNRYHCIYFMKINGTLIILPVTYRTFDATLNNNKVNLFWITDAETGNGHFEVERSFDQTNFSTAGIILGAQSGNKVSNQYSFKDDTPELLNHKVIYYRLKQVDVDGRFTYSVVKMVRINNTTTKLFVQVSPNPYMDKLNVNFVSDASGKAEVRLINASGGIIKRIESTISRGYNNLQLQDLNSQAPGIYIVNVVVNGKSIDSQKIIKQ